MNNALEILATKPSKDYELLDSGSGENSNDSVILSCEDLTQSIVAKSSPDLWENVHAEFVTSGRSGNWKK